MSSKTCSMCGNAKSLAEFYRMRSHSDGYRPECKECSKIRKRASEARDPIKSKARRMAQHILHRTRKPTGRNACYNGVKCLIGTNIEEVTTYILEHFTEDLEKFQREGTIASIDRIDSSKHYEPGNLRIISWYDNSVLGAQKGAKATSKPVRAVYPDGSVKEFTSVKQASEAIGCKRDTILACIKAGEPTKGSRNGYMKPENVGIRFER